MKNNNTLQEYFKIDSSLIFNYNIQIDKISIINKEKKFETPINKVTNNELDKLELSYSKIKKDVEILSDKLKSRKKDLLENEIESIEKDKIKLIEISQNALIYYQQLINKNSTDYISMAKIIKFLKLNPLILKFDEEENDFI